MVGGSAKLTYYNISIRFYISLAIWTGFVFYVIALLIMPNYEFLKILSFMNSIWTSWFPFLSVKISLTGIFKSISFLFLRLLNNSEFGPIE